ncbi:MAG: hypothetical protein QOD99_1469, partial [Chthoniobacter sp.]|nr:hypothetical protein [Chthoniobacter sp.]
FEQNRGAFPLNTTPDTYQAPLNPFINSLFLRLVKDSWQMTPKDVIGIPDRLIAGVALSFFLASVALNFNLGKRLFDRRLALLGMGLILVSDTFWQFSISGLPQMLMLFLFSLCSYTFVRAIEARQEARSPVGWLLLCGVAFGLLALAHALTIWIFLGALLFSAVAFWPSEGTLGKRILKHPFWLLLGVFLIFYTPWLMRNYLVCGSPFGLAPYAALLQIRGTESFVMRTLKLDVTGISPIMFRVKMQSQIIGQLSAIYGYLGRSLAAPIFFVALLHLFKSPATAVFKWAVLSMSVAAVFGMAVFGLDGSGLQSNDLFVLFVPIFIFYGMAFLLVLWTRLTTDMPHIDVRLVRVAFLTLIYLISALPLCNTLLSPSAGRVQWPPYVPPFISLLNKWTDENEIIASDMPWAVAWYADRKSLWLPMTINDFISLNDYNQLGGRIVGLYLTPVTGNRALVLEIVKGEYKEWAPFILRNVNARDFPLHAVTALPIDNECIFYSDHDRWSEKTD